MDLAPKRIYDTFIDEVWEDLGPLDPNWFDTLTAEAFAQNVSDQDELCANQECNFKTPLDKKAADSQMFSTPKVFRHNRTLSPEADNESFTSEQETQPWTTASPCLLTKERMPNVKSYAVLHSPDSLAVDPFQTPNKSPISFAKRISESLGAQVGDISWTSSLNTPPPLPSTIILTKKDSSSTATLSVDRNVFARKLFSPYPSASGLGTVTPKNNAARDQRGAAESETELNESSHASLNGGWRQTVPDAIEDVEVRSTVASVLHGAENALSIFFTNSSSISRKVRNERTKRKQIIPAQGNGSDAVEASPINKDLPSDDHANVPPSENTAGLTQWSPLNISEIQDTESRVTKKKAHFVYTVEGSRSQAKHMNFQKASPDTSKNCCVSQEHQVQTVENVTGEKALDISQFSTSLTQDLSQMPGPVKHSVVTEEAVCNGFNPSACLSALKRAKQRAKQGDIQHCEDIAEPVMALKPSCINDRGFQSEHIPVPTTNHPQSEKDITADVQVLNLDQEVNATKCPNEPVSDPILGQLGFKMASNKSIQISSTTLNNAKDVFNDIEEKENGRHPLSNGKFKIQTDTGKANNRENGICHLTASQKADVKELCTLLEESASQFEFTQFRVTNINQACHKKGSPSPKSEIDPDFLNGIDFNESFSSVTDSQTHVEMSHNDKKQVELTNCTKKDTSDVSPVKNNENRPQCNKLNKDKSWSDEGLKTAQGNIGRVSKKCLHKVRSLCADVNSNATTTAHSKFGQNMLLKNDRCSELIKENDEICGKNLNPSVSKGFKMASGKEISVSPKAMQKAKSFFQDCDVDYKDGNVDVVGNVQNEYGFKNAQLLCKNIHKDDAKTDENVPAYSEHTSALGACFPLSGCVDTGENAKPVGDDQTNYFLLSSPNSGFKTASGKGLTISASAIVKAKLLLSENVENNMKSHCSKVPLNGQMQKTQGFVAASERSMVVSAQALQKAKSLFADINSTVDTNNFSCKKKGTENRQINRETIKSGFTTVEQARVKFLHPRKMKNDIVANCNLASAKHPETSSAVGNMCLGTKEPKTHNELPADKTIICQATSYKSAQQHASDPNIDHAVSKISLPQDTLLKNKCMSETDTTGQTVIKDSETLQCGFTTARGRQVQVSKKYVDKVKHLWKEFDADCTNNTNELNVTKSQGSKDTPTFKRASSDVSSLGSGLSTAKTVSSSEDAPTATLLPSQNIGFQTAGGGKVSISSAALKKAKQMWSEYEDGEALTDSMVKNNAPSTSGFQAASGKQVTVLAEALLKAKALFDNINSAPETTVNFETRQTPKNITAKSTAEDTENHVAMKTTDLDKGSSVSGLKTDIVKTPSAPHEATRSSKPMLQVNGDQISKVDTNFQTLPPQNNGFQTAGGKQERTSCAALKKAKSLLNKFDNNEDHKILQGPVNATPPMNYGFQAASGKPVSVSAKAMQKAKALFDYISPTADTPDRQNTHLESRLTTLGGAKVHMKSFENSGGFATASGKKVTVSEEAMTKAKKLLSDEKMPNEQMSYQSSLPSLNNGLEDTEKVEVGTHPKQSLKETASRASGFQAASGKPVAVSAKVLQKVKALFDDISSTEETPDGAETKKTNAGHGLASSERAPVAKKILKLDAITSNLNPLIKMDMATIEMNHNCTGTQQQLLAQEALDCTMALLEDEVRAAQSLINLEHISVSSSTSVEAQNQTGKRPAEGVTNQPPLKRRLLEEFDRTLDGPKGSALNPVKSCPNGLLKDRRVFQYSVSLHPNVTKPHGCGKDYAERKVPSAPASSRPANPKTPVFVPPFLNTRTQTLKNTTQKDNKGTASTCVPPFKKLKTDVQEKDTKAQDEDSNYQSVRTTFKTPTFIPPPSRKKTNLVNDSKTKKDTLPDRTNEDPPELYNTNHKGTEEREKNVTNTHEILENLDNIELSRDMQDMRIRKKKRQTVRALPGSLFLTKSSKVKRIPLTAAVNGETPQKYNQKQLYSYGVHHQLSQITSETAQSFCFNLLKFHKQEAFVDGGGVQLADGGWLIPRNDGTAGKEEFYKALCDTPGVDPNLLSPEWVYNHYRWIVWKLVSMERSFPKTMAGVCLTPEQVLLQLKYRYDVEVDHSRRSALRKITEKDDTSAKRIVLCVCGIISNGRLSPRTPGPLQNSSGQSESSCGVVWLTDGWYSIRAQLDQPLTAMLHKGQISEGVKLMIHGAQLLGSQDACPPLEAPESLMLKICANSTRRVRWDTKLGFHRDPRPFLLPLSSLFGNGGPAGAVDMVVLRSYPIQWMERKPDGTVLFRSARAEEKEARQYNNHKQNTMEAVYAKIQAEFEKEEKGKIKTKSRRRTVKQEDLCRLQDAEELYDAVGDDPAYVEAHLNEEQVQTLGAYRRSLLDQRQAELQERFRRALEEAEANKESCPKRDVTTVWRLSIKDYLDQTGSSVYQLSIWKPSSDLLALLKEGCRYRVYNLATSEGKKRGGSSTVQLTSTKKTQFQDLQSSQEWLVAHFKPRVSVSFTELKNPDFLPLCAEVDLTGVVISIIDQHGFSPAFYLVDGSLNFVKVRGFVSLSQCGWEDVVKPRVMLALSNLQLRGQCVSPTLVLYAGDMTVLSTNPREIHLQQSLSQLRDTLQGQEDFFLKAQERFSEIVISEGRNTFSVINHTTPKTPKVPAQDTKANVSWQQTVRTLGARTPSLPNASVEKDPKSLKRRRALDYLSRIPSPPPLSHLNTGASPFVKKTFQPPRRSGAPTTPMPVQTPAPREAPVEEGWVHDEELAMIDTQDLRAADALLTD